MDIQIYIKYFVALLALVNPVGLLPVFIAMTTYQDKQTRNKTNLTANISVATILLTALFLGNLILNMFGISVDAFRIAGGVLVMTIAFSMINGKLGEHKQNKQEQSEAVAKESIAVVPLALPLMAGPGAISSTILWSMRYSSWMHLLGFALTILVFSFCCWLIFRSASIVSRYMGQTGINVITRIMGLLLMALGAEMITTGLKVIFPGLS